MSLPATNLNIGMDLWNPSSAGPGAVKMQSNLTGVSPVGREGMMTDQWIQVSLISYGLCYIPIEN